MSHQTAGKIVRLSDVEWVDNETVDPEMWPYDKVRWKTLVSEALTGSQSLLFGIAELAPGEIHMLHDHPDSDEVYFVLGGSGRVVLDDEQFDVGPEVAVFIPAGLRHEIANVGSQTLRFVWAFNKGVEAPDRWARSAQ